MTNIFRLPYSYIRPIYEKTAFHKRVISEIEDYHLRVAYSHCRAITSLHAKTFYMATRFLPYNKQRSIFAIYGLCRYLDHLVDEAEDLIEKKIITQSEICKKLDDFELKIHSIYEGRGSDHPILVAFSDTVARCNIPLNLPLQLLNGVKEDLFKNRYDTFGELYGYSYNVASVVGLMTSRVFGYHNEDALNHAIELGIAMQLTNILRDVGEDLKQNRIYLPQEELKSYGITEENLFDGLVDETFKGFMQFQIARARTYFERAEQGIWMLSQDSRLPVMLAKENYSRILNKIEENDYQVFDNRAYLNSTEKLFMVPKVVLQL